jgi:hypothetical protein
VGPTRALGWANAIGRGLGRIGLRPSLEEESLLRAARRVTRLSDFGDEGFRLPLRRMLQSYAEDAPLSPSGRLLRRIDFVDMLANRLRVERAIAREPRIADDPVRSPLIVTGLPRTGTTLLQRLLSLDPDARALLTWEAMWPGAIARARGGAVDPRIRYTRRLVWMARRLLPGIDRVHPLDPEGPEECTRLLDSSFRCAYFAVENRLPGYAGWLESEGPDAMLPAYRWYARQLQVLQSQRPASGRWVLKSPAHLGNLDALLRVIPDARIVITLRDPREAVASACSLFALLYATTAEDSRTGRMGPGVAASLARALMQGLESAARDPARVRVVRYDDLVAHPVATLEAVHAGFGLPFSAALESSARAWLAANPQGRHGVHRYNLESYGLDAETVDRLFAGPDRLASRLGAGA